MQPRSGRTLSTDEFRRVRDRIRTLSIADTAISSEPGWASDLPEEIGLQLTNRCNLRCDHCFQWNDQGFHHLLPVINQNDDLDIRIIERLLADTRSVRSKIFLWGGEPLVYRDWDRLSQLLADDPRHTVLCTNGIGLDKKLASLCRMSSQLVALISIDGFEEANDRIRGRNTYKNIMRGVEALLAAQARGDFKGAISISCVINDECVEQLFDFAQYFEDKGVDSVYFVFPWYIPPVTAGRMDDYFRGRFSWLHQQNGAVPSSPSWHSYTWRLSPEKLDLLRGQISRIMQRTWDVRVRFQPDLEAEEIGDFINGSERPAQRRRRCISVATRLNVLPDARMTMCKLFPEFSTASLATTPLRDAWRGEAASRAREVFSCGLTPVCSKCVQLYLQGV